MSLPFLPISSFSHLPPPPLIPQEVTALKLVRLQEQLSHSVPHTVLEDANRQYSELVHKYQALLQQVMVEEEEKGEEGEVVKAGRRVRMLSEQLMQTQTKVEQLREQIDGEQPLK